MTAPQPPLSVSSRTVRGAAIAALRASVPAAIATLRRLANGGGPVAAEARRFSAQIERKQARGLDNIARSLARAAAGKSTITNPKGTPQ